MFDFLFFYESLSYYFITCRKIKYMPTPLKMLLINKMNKRKGYRHGPYNFLNEKISVFLSQFRQLL